MKFKCINTYIVILILIFVYRINVYICYNLSCIVIRINEVTIEQMQRYFQWIDCFPQNYNFYLLSMRKVNISKNNIQNIIVTFNNVMAIFPNITKLKGNCSSFKLPKLLSWISHSESIILFYKKIKTKYNYIWIIEQDVGYSGNLYQFIKLYDNNTSDFITINVGKKTNKWVWFYCATDKYIKRRTNIFKSDYGYATREYIQRWSKSYISKMFEDLSNQYHSQSETSSIEMVFYHNLTYEEIPKKYIGSPLCAGMSITKHKWESILLNKNKSNKFYHPLKF